MALSQTFLVFGDLDHFKEDGIGVLENAPPLGRVWWVVSFGRKTVEDKSQSSGRGVFGASPVSVPVRSPHAGEGAVLPRAQSGVSGHRGPLSRKLLSPPVC